VPWQYSADTLKGTKVLKIKCITQYNLAIGSVDLNEEMAQPYTV
jgi:hypothetical protein